jgi:myosin-15
MILGLIFFQTLQGGHCNIDGKTDREDFESLLSAMQVLGFSAEERDTIFKILASA